MAKINFERCDNQRDAEKSKFRKDPATGDVYVAVTDGEAHLLLEQILQALGGSSNTTTTVQNIAVANANVEQSFVLPANVKKFLIRSRNKGTITLSYASGGDYLTVPAGSSYVDNSFYQSQTIYFTTSKNADVVELVTYV